MNKGEKRIMRIALSYISYDDKNDFISDVIKDDKDDEMLLNKIQCELENFDNDENMETYKIVDKIKSLLKTRVE